MSPSACSPLRDPLLNEEVARGYADDALRDRQLDPDELAQLRFLLKESVSVVERLQSALHPVSAYVVLPVFALANAGVELGAIGKVFTEPVGLGIMLGLVVGKPRRHLPGVVRRRTLRAGAAARRHLLADGPRPRRGRRHRLHRLDLHRRAVLPRLRTLTEEAKIAILLASLFAAIVGVVVLLASTGSREESDDAEEPDHAGSATSDD